MTSEQSCIDWHGGAEFNLMGRHSLLLFLYWMVSVPPSVRRDGGEGEEGREMAGERERIRKYICTHREKET